MAAFLIFLSVMGNAAAVVALALHLDPELTGLMSRTLFYIGTVPLTFGLCGFGVFVGAARDDYRRWALERQRKRQEKERQYQQMAARLAEKRKDDANFSRAMEAEWEASGGKFKAAGKPVDDTFWLAVRARAAAQKATTTTAG